MFRAMIISSDLNASQAIEQLARQSGMLRVDRTLASNSSRFEVVRDCNIMQPDLIFLEFRRDTWDQSQGLVALLRDESPASALIGFGEDWIEDWKTQMTGWGVSDLMAYPLSVESFSRAVFSGIHSKLGGVRDNVVAIIPAKAGNGASTVTFNLAAHLTNDISARVLVVDADGRSGILAEMAGVRPKGSLQGSFREGDRMTPATWRSYATPCHGFDLLASDRRMARPLPSWVDYHHLFHFACPRYDFVLVDLPELVNNATVEVVRWASRVLVVCTPEASSLTLAAQRCQELEENGVSDSRVSVIVNRWHRREIEPAEVSEILQLTVAAVLPNDYPSVRVATDESRPVDPSGPLGRSFAGLAAVLSGRPGPSPQPEKSALSGLRRFLGGRQPA